MQMERTLKTFKRWCRVAAPMPAQRARSTGKKTGAAKAMRPARGAAGARPKPQEAAGLPQNVVVRRTSEIDPKDPIASGTTAPLRKIWLDAAREARDHRRVVIDLVGEGRGVIAIPVVFDDEKEAMETMTPALDMLVTHCASASASSDRPVMVDLQELRERLKLEPEEDWIAGHGWFHNALASRELLCMYVFSPGYLFEFATAIGEKQSFAVAIARQDPGFYELKPEGKGTDGVIIWNWARAIGDVITSGHAWSYFGMLLALAPAVAERQKAEAGARKPAPQEEE